MISVNDHCCMIILIFTGKTTKIVIVTFVLLQLGTTAGLHFSIMLSLSHIYALSKKRKRASDLAIFRFGLHYN